MAGKGATIIAPARRMALKLFVISISSRSGLRRRIGLDARVLQLLAQPFEFGGQPFHAARDRLALPCSDVGVGHYVRRFGQDRKSTRLNSSPQCAPRMPYSS